jgi:hypothetical protein
MMIAEYLVTNASFSKNPLCVIDFIGTFERKKLKPIVTTTNNTLYIFFQTPTTHQIVQKIMTKHIATYKTDDEVLAEILDLKKLKPASPELQTNLTEQVSMI